MAGLPVQNPIPGAPLLDPLGEPMPPTLVGPIPAVPPTAPPQVPQALLGPPPALEPEQMGPPEEEGPPASLAGTGAPSEADLAGAEPLPFPPKTWFEDEEATFGGGQGTQLQQKPNQDLTDESEARFKAAERADYLAKQKAAGKLTHAEKLEDIQQGQAEAYAKIAAADKEESAYNQAEGVRIAKEAEEKQAAADQALETAHKEATTKRQALDVEAIAIANTKTDPNRAVSNMSIGKKIALVIAAGLQGYRNGAMGKAGAQNNIMDFLNGMIDQDLKAQQMDIANRTSMLGARGQINQQQWGAEMDMNEARYKSVAKHYEMAKNQMQAAALQFNNPRIDAKLALNNAELDKWKLGEQDTYEAAMRKESLERQQFAEQKRVNAFNQAREARADAENARRYAVEQAAKKAPQELTAAEKAEARHYEAEDRARTITSSTGEDISKADTPQDRDSANQVLQYNKQLNGLAQRGLDLFKDGYAWPGNPRRAAQQSWITSWAQVRRFAGGDTSAPNDKDRGNWGVKDDSIIADNPAIILDQLEDARIQGDVVLKRNRVSDEWRRKEGFMARPEAPTPGHTVPLLYRDDSSGYVSYDPSGTPLSEEDTKAWLKDQAAKEARLRGGPSVEGVPLNKRPDNPWAPGFR